MHEAFGVRLTSDFDLPELRPTEDGPAPMLHLTATSCFAVDGLFSGACDPRRTRRANVGDGRTYFVEHGVAGDIRIDYADEASFHLDPGARRVACAPRRFDDPGWRRFLLDTVLGTASLVHGFELLHAAACIDERGVLAIVSASGGGKSTLLAELIMRGRAFFSDDLLALSPAHDHVVGHGGPPLMNMAVGRPDGRRQGAVGRILARMSDEYWVAVHSDRCRVGAAPVARVVILRRGGVARLTVERATDCAADLLRNTMTSGSTPERRLARFDLLSRLASTATIVRVAAPSDVAPSVLADAVACA